MAVKLPGGGTRGRATAGDDMTIALSSWRPPLQALAFYLACLASAWLTEWANALPGNVSIWLPTGILFAALSATLRQRWIWWIAAAIAAELTGNLIWYHHAAGPAMLLTVGNSVAALIGSMIVQKWLGRRLRLASIRDAVAFCIVGAFIVPLLSATAASVALGWSYDKPPFSAWLRIFLGDHVGGLIGGPLVVRLITLRPRRDTISRHRIIEAVLVAVALVGVSIIALGSRVPIAYVVIPAVLWAALRFRIWGAILATLVVTVIAAVATFLESSPFAITYEGQTIGAIRLQLFLGIAALSALLVAAISEEHRRALRALERRLRVGGRNLAASRAEADRSSALLRAISEASPDLIYAKDRQGRLIYANNATLRVMGMPARDAIGHAVSETAFDTSEGEVIDANDMHIMAHGKVEIFDEPYTSPDGNHRIFRSTKSPLRDAGGAVIGLAGVSVDMTDTMASHARERLLAQEIDHRAKNLLTVVQSIVQLTRADSLSTFKAAITGRIHALARTHSLLAKARWDGAELTQLLNDEFAPHDIAERITLSGGPVFLNPAAAQAIALVIHELTTNATKYGSLSVAEGRLYVSWTIAGEKPSTLLSLKWCERDGPPVRTPTRRGFGSKIVRATVEQQYGGKIEFDWDVDGLSVTMTLPIDKRPDETVD